MSIILLVLQSCERKTQTIPLKKSNLIEIDSLIDLADTNNKNLKYDSSYYYYEKAKSLCDIKKDTGKIIYCTINLANIEGFQGDYTSCENTIIELFPLLVNNKKPIRRWSVFMSIGCNYLRIYDYNNALHYFNKSLNLETDYNSKLGAKNNIALVYMEMHNYQKAIKILETLTSQEKKLELQEDYSRVIDNLGLCYSKTGNPKATTYLYKGLELRKKNHDELGITASYINLAEHFKKSIRSLGLKYAKLAYKRSTDANIVDDRLLSLQLIIETSPENKLRKLALDYTHIKDSITKARQIAKNQFAKIKYDSKLDREENLRLKVLKAENAFEIEHQKNRNFMLNFMITISLLLTVFLFYYLTFKYKKEKIHASYETETRIAKKLHDELANDVYSTLSFSETQDLSLIENKEKLINNLDTIYTRTRNISEEIGEVDTGIHFLNGLKEMMKRFNTNSVTILLNGIETVDWNSIENNKKIIIYRVLQELLVNMKKHSQCSLAVITFKNKKTKIQIDYGDNGIGFAFDEIKPKRGLQNAENRILAINGSFTLDLKPNKGFKTSFTIPI
jgi:signal transduction histidine kinase